MVCSVITSETNKRGLPDAGWPYQAFAVATDKRKRRSKAQVQFALFARSEGMMTMIEDGVAKCRAGLTTIDEVFRVTANL